MLKLDKSKKIGDDFIKHFCEFCITIIIFTVCLTSGMFMVKNISFANANSNVILEENSNDVEEIEISKGIGQKYLYSSLEEKGLFYSVLNKFKNLQPIPYAYAQNLFFSDENSEDANVEYEVSLDEITPENYKREIDVNNVVFVGNSLVEGMRLNSYDNNVFLCKVGVSLDGLKSSGIYSKLKQYDCDTVVIEMGTNELGGYSKEGFINSYVDLINHIYEINPNSRVICLSIPPVSRAKDNSGTRFNNTNVMLYNGYISDMCNELSIEYIDCSEFFGNVLSDNLSSGGIHLTGRAYQAWYAFVIDRLRIM